MKECLCWNPVYQRKNLCVQWESNLEPVDQQTSAEPTGNPTRMRYIKSWNGQICDFLSMSQNQSLNTKKIFLFFTHLKRCFSLFYRLHQTAARVRLSANNLFNVKSPKCARRLTTWDYPNSQKGRLNEPCTTRAKGSDMAASVHCMAIPVSKAKWPGCVAQSVGHLARKSDVLGSIPGLATYFRFSFRWFKRGSCQLLAKVCTRSTG